MTDAEEAAPAPDMTPPDDPRTDPCEARYQALFRELDAGVLVMRGSECIDCNPAAARLFGLARPEELIGRTPLDFATPTQPDGRDSAEWVRENIETAIAKGSHAFEWRARKVGGEEFFMAVRFTPIRIGGELLFQCIAVDVTDRRRADQALEASRRELATYHDLVTHDFANFSTTLFGLLDELLGGEIDLSSEVARNLLRSARRQAFEMSRIAENARTMSRLREGRGLRDERTAPLDRCLEGAIETIRAIHFDREIDLRLERNATLSVHRVPMLDNVLLNLLDNAVRHAPKGGPVRIRVKVETPEKNPAGVRIRITGGRAPDSAVVADLFHRWQPGPRSGGSGLGLSLAREILVRAGGSIEAGIEPIDGEPAFSVLLELPTPEATS